jgi:hypothetical protein
MPIYGLLLCYLLIHLTGCATQPEKALTSDFWFKRQKSVAVMSFPIPKAQQHINGQQGGVFDLMGSLIHESAPTPLKIRLGQIPPLALQTLPRQITERLIQQGFNVKEVATPPHLRSISHKEGFSQYDIKQERSYFGTDYVLILHTPSWGLIRSCYGVIPLGAPQAHVELSGELIDTNDNHLAWYYNNHINQTIQGEWNQGPHYDNLVRSIEITVEEAKQKLLRDFFRTATLPEPLANRKNETPSPLEHL